MWVSNFVLRLHVSFYFLNRTCARHFLSGLVRAARPTEVFCIVLVLMLRYLYQPSRGLTCTFSTFCAP